MTKRLVLGVVVGIALWYLLDSAAKGAAIQPPPHGKETLMAGVSNMTRAAWGDWHFDQGHTTAREMRSARCEACGRTITIGQVAAFVPAVGDKPTELICDRCVIEPPETSQVQIAAAKYDQLVGKMLRDGLVTRRRDGALALRSYGRDAVEVLDMIRHRDQAGLPHAG